jgi:hypothetical protein
MITFRASVAPKGSPTEPVFACRATASTQNPHRGAASGWRVVSRDGDDYFEIAALRSTKSGGGYSCCDSLSEFLKDTASPS